MNYLVIALQQSITYDILLVAAEVQKVNTQIIKSIYNTLTRWSVSHHSTAVEGNRSDTSVQMRNQREVLLQD